MELLGEPMTTLVLALLLLFLLHRHNVLSYGTHIWESPSMILLGVLMVSQYSLGYAALSTLILTSIVFVGLCEYIITSIAQPKSPFLAFNIGLGIGFLAFLHPAWLLTLPSFAFLLSKIGLGTWRHYSGLIIGSLGAPWIGMLLLAPRSLSGVGQYFLRFLEPLWHPALPSGAEWVTIGLIALLLTILTVYTVVIQEHAIARYRWVTHIHIGLSWLLLVLDCIYHSPELPILLFPSFLGIACIATFLFAHARKRLPLIISLSMPALALLVVTFLP